MALPCSHLVFLSLPDELLRILERDALRSQQVAFALGTQANHRTEFRAYQLFCSFFDLPPLPANPHQLACYAQFLSRSMKSPASISQYLSAVNLLHKMNGLPPCSTSSFEIQQTLRGIKKTLAQQPRERHPLTPEVLLTLRSSLDLSLPQDLTLWSAILIAFFSYLRKSNLVPPSSTKFDPIKHLSRQAILVAKSSLLVNVSWSKTLQARERTISIPVLAIPGHPLCPVTAYRRMVAALPGQPGDPAFLLPGRSFLTASKFEKAFSALITNAGFPKGHFTPHDLRRGGYTLAFEAGVPRELRRVHGDWKSDADLLYLKLLLQERLRLPAAMRAIILARLSYNPETSLHVLGPPFGQRSSE
ncbi:Hypp1093 [Branchiostoma lanceolatum]|uniref:Hypp1093 protein n=1 Tax=Branchiostoma lanceolatum TaxID=7740 RepID=A0A8K0EIZ4_BRALA|nr:Hypp1093 [Branchiostoma lanceolatum]